MKEIELGEILEQYRITEIINDSTEYKQITISQTGEIKVRGFKKGSSIGRKRQFIIDLKKHPNTLLFVRQGVQKGGIGIAGTELHGSIVTENMPMFEISNKVNPTFLDFYLKSPVFKNKVNSIEATGTAQKSVHERVLLKIKINLPNRKEQDLLVKKLIETKKNFKILNEEYLNQERNLTKLRQSILQDAVQGKLTQEWRLQNPNVTPASALLKTIKAEKEQLIKEKKIKKEKPLPAITKEEIPFEIPESWVWCRFGNITTIKGGKRLPKGEKLTRENTGYIYLRVTDMKNGTVDERDLHYLTPQARDVIKNYTISKDEIYLTIVGATIGKLGIIPDKFDGVNLTENAVKIYPYFNNKDYVKNTLNSNLIQNQFFDKTLQVGVPKLAIHRINKTLFPLVPIEEQKVIVKKVNQLLAYCDNLEQEIKISKANAEKLMQSVLSELLGEEN